MADDDPIQDDQDFESRSFGTNPYGNPGTMFDPGATALAPKPAAEETDWAAGAGIQVTPAAANALGGAQAGGASTSPNLDDRIQSYMDRADAADERVQTVQEAKDRRMGPLYDKLESELDQPRPEMPQFEQQPKAPKQQIGQGAMEYLQVATLLAALAGGFARRGSTTALNAFAGAIKGFTEGNIQVFKAKSEEWKQNSQEVLQNNQAKLDSYNAIMKDRKMGIDQKMQEMQIVASQYDDSITYNLSQQRNYTSLVASLTKERQLQADAGLKHEKLAGEVQKLKDQHDQATAPPDPNEVEAIATGHKPYLTGFMARTPNGRATMREVLARPDHVGAEVFPQRVKSLKDFMTGTQGNTVRSFDVAISHMGTFQKLGDALGNGNVPLANALKNELRTQFGNPNMPSFNFAKKIVADEVMKVILGGNIGTQEERLAIQRDFDAARSPEQLQAVITTGKALMAGQLEGYRKQFVTSLGRPEEEFFNRLSPNTVASLKGKDEEFRPQVKAPKAKPNASFKGKTSTVGGKTYYEINGEWFDNPEGKP